jgi:hypothetical protein
MEHKQQLLAGAVSAWNIASLPPRRRRAGLRKFMREYKRMNPEETEQDYRDVEDDMRQLIKKKSELYPDVSRQIIGARVEDRGGRMYVEAASIRESG